MTDTAGSNGSILYLHYEGGSMRSLFRQRDWLRVRRCGLEGVRAGDVIVFRHRDEERLVVHRMMRHTSDGLVTRGDDSVMADALLVRADELVGRVQAVRRNDRWHVVKGGLQGLIRGRVWQGLRVAHLGWLRLSGQVERDLMSDAPHRARRLSGYLLNLIAAARSGQLKEVAGSIPDSDWPGLLTLANRHELTPFLSHELHSHNLLDALPDAVADGFRVQYRQAWVRQQRLLTAHREIVEALEKAGLQVIALKGLYYAHALYPDPGARTMTDLDYMVRQKDLARALDVFESLGYHSIQHSESAAQDKEIWLFHHERQIKIDLHVGILPAWAALDWPVDSIWERAEEIELDGLHVQVLSPEDQLMHVVLHGSLEHLFQPLRVLLDARLAFDRWGKEVDGGRLRTQAEEIGLGPALDLLEQVMQRTFDDSNEILTEFRRTAPAGAIDWVLHTAPVLDHSTLLTLFAARDYLMFGETHVLRRLMRRPAADKNPQASGNAGGITSWLRPDRVVRLLRHGFSFLGLGLGLIYGIARHPERGYVRFLRLLWWLNRG